MNDDSGCLPFLAIVTVLLGVACLVVAAIFVLGITGVI